MMKPRFAARAARAAMLLVVVAMPSSSSAADADDSGETKLIRLVRLHSKVVTASGPVASVAVGSPGVARTTVLTPVRVLVNAVAPGTTSMMLLLRNGRMEQYRVVVTHDLTHLQRLLSSLDPRIRAESDPNGDAVILQGTAASKAIVERATEAAYRFFGEVTVTTTPDPTAGRGGDARRGRRQGEGTTRDPDAAPEGGVAGAAADESRLQEIVAVGTTRVINLLLTDDQLAAPAVRLEGVLKRVDPAIRVEEVNGVFILRGRVVSPATLGRAIAVADRFVTGKGDLDIRVFSDRGGVLAGNLDAEEAAEVISDPLRLQRIGVGGIGGAGAGGAARSSAVTGGGGGGGVGVGAGATALSIVPRASPPKGNLGQNISRGDVVTTAGGRVVSLLTVADQPRIELKLNLVAVDRDRTDRLGINWRIDGSRVQVDTPGATASTSTGVAASTLPALAPGGITALTKLAAGGMNIQTFLQALEQTGAGRTVSEPLITAVSGEAASFLVGGNLPIPVTTFLPGTVTQNAVVATNVAFIEFGLRIVARPTALENGRIGIVLDQILTEPDDTAAIVINNARIPGFKQRSVRTVTESFESETWAVAGLVADTDTRSTSAIPLLSRIPVLGALFRNRSEDKSRSELIVTITARRVPDRVEPLVSAVDPTQEESR
jgi:Flp pilus assembly secretin CpaC